MNRAKNNPLVLLASVWVVQLLEKLSKLFKARLYFGQTGEDVIIQKLLKEKHNPYYVDVGCNHPISLSNTFGLYLQGGKGICVDANRDMTEIYKRVRPRDVVLNTLVSDSETTVDFYMTSNHSMNSASPEFALKMDQDEIHTVQMETRTLSSLLEEHLPKGQEIDLLSIDVEGLDFEVLSSLDFDQYRPKVIVVEIHGLDISSVQQDENPVVSFLKDRNYTLKYYATMNAYFLRQD